ncbi:hypothetical protein G3O00_07730 [Burkholderia sp. Ac-20384]|uniref:hypothetical protein n=1 Tax=Burkholderia sp. Ac-20384 TaxID=2703902 RepID=UPI00197E4DFE|nr:hypothetical protein [Burkholderia sp. Ac-20384]MBN3823506.1 hypothetical protein [Burkholderia sp. Ac-20384]
MLRWGGRLQLPKMRPKGGTRLFVRALWMSLWHGFVAYGSAFAGTAVGVGAASLVAAVGLVDRLHEFDKHARFVDFGAWVIAVVTAGAGMSLFLMGAVMGLAFRHLYLVPRVHLAVGLLTAFAFFLPTVGLSVGWIVLPAALLVWWGLRALETPDSARIEWLLHKYYRGFPELQDWIREYIVTAWMSASRPAPQPLPQTELPSVATAVVNRRGLASSLFDEHLSEMSQMYPRLKGSVIEDEWSALIRTSKRIHQMVGTDAERYSLLNHFLASQMPNAIRLGWFFVKADGLTESNPSRAEHMHEIEAGLKGLLGQFEKVQNQMAESDLEGLQALLRVLNEDLKQAEQREASAPPL